MENEKPKMERYQKVLTLLSHVFFTIAIILFSLRIVDIFDMGLWLVFIPLFISNILQSTARWNDNPKWHTVMIAAYAFLLGLVLSVLLDKLI